MNNYKWDIFASTGKIRDYLKYKEIEDNSLSECSQFACIKGEKINADNDRRNSTT